MEELFLSRHVHYCRVDDGIVFMDLRTGTYLGIGVQDAQALSKAVPGFSCAGAGTAAQSDAEKLVNTLMERGILTRHRESGKNAAAVVNLEQTAAEDVVLDLARRPPVRPHHVMNFVIAYARACAQLRWRSLARIVGSVESRKRAHGGSRDAPHDASARVQDLALVFRRLRPLMFTSRNACLLDSLVLVEFLSRYKLFPAWFFGVRTRPFAAHSWVQDGTLVLNGTVDYAERYVPLLSV